MKELQIEGVYKFIKHVIREAGIESVSPEFYKLYWETLDEDGESGEFMVMYLLGFFEARGESLLDSPNVPDEEILEGVLKLVKKEEG
jgi:hypothetical protein